MPDTLAIIGNPLPGWIAAGLGFLLGAVIGSYLATILWRWPRGMSANAGRSHCDDCDRTLAWYELIPIGGYFLARGRCRTCGQSFTMEHWLFETFCALAGAYFFAAGVWWLAVIVWLLALLALCDLRYLRLPDPLVAALAIVAILAPPFEPLSLPQRLAGGAVAFASFWTIATAYRLLRKQEGLGRGDVKLFGAMGLWTGPFVLPELLLLACLLGFADLAIRAARGVSLQGLRLPLGAYLAIAMIGFAGWYAAGQPQRVQLANLNAFALPNEPQEPSF